MTEADLSIFAMLFLGFSYLGLIIVVLRRDEDIKDINDDISILYRELGRLKHDPEGNSRPNRHSTSPPDAILQGGKSDIDGTKLRD